MRPVTVVDIDEVAMNSFAFGQDWSICAAFSLIQLAGSVIGNS